MTGMVWFGKLSLAGCMLGLLLLAPSTWADGPVRVGLHPEVEVSHAVVKVRDVAELEGGTGAVQSQIGGLDLVEIPSVGDRRVLSGRQVLLRIVLSGVSSQQVAVQGAERAVVRRTAPDPDRPNGLAGLLVQSLQRQLASQLNVSQQDVRVRPLRQPELPSWPDAEMADAQVQLLAGSRLELGRMYPKVVLVADDRISPPIPLALEALARTRVPVSTRRVERGETLNQDNVQWASRWIDGQQQYVPQQQLEGAVASRPIASGQTITSDMVRKDVEDQDPYLVDRRRPVRLIARRGALTVYLHGAEPLQRGRQGDSIRVRNPSSRKVLTGQVVGEDEVEVSF